MKNPEQIKQRFWFRFWDFLSLKCYQIRTSIEEMELRLANKAGKYDVMAEPVPEIEEDHHIDQLPYETRVFFIERKILVRLKNLKAIPKPVLIDQLGIAPADTAEFDEALMNLIQKGLIQISRPDGQTTVIHKRKPAQGSQFSAFSH